MTAAREHGFLDDLKIDLSILDELGFNPYRLPLKRAEGIRFEIDGTLYLDLASNDYLSLTRDKRLARAVKAAIDQYGTSTCGTPAATGSIELISELELRLSRFVGLEATVVFPSCYQANTSLFASIVTREDAVLIDHYAHSSLVQGVRASNCKIIPFLHNDCDHLEKLLSRCERYPRTAVVTESVFSTEGTVAPLDEIIPLCCHYGAIPVIDDSHGLGVIGSRGKGVLEHFDIDEFNGIYTTSLGKALANAGGIISGGAQFIEYLRYSCPGLLYSTALTPASAAGTICALDIIERDFGRIRNALYGNSSLVKRAVETRGYDVEGGDTPIVSIKCGDKRRTVDLARRLFDRRIVTTPFVEPSVPPGKGVVRLIVQAGLTEDECQLIVDAIEDSVEWLKQA